METIPIKSLEKNWWSLKGQTAKSFFVINTANFKEYRGQHKDDKYHEQVKYNAVAVIE